MALAVEARREGVSFDAFWERAVRPGRSPLITTETENPPPEAVVWPRDSSDRANAIHATKSAKEYWRRAYDREPPTRGERALTLLLGLTGDPGGSMEGGGVSLATAP